MNAQKNNRHCICLKTVTWLKISLVMMFIALIFSSPVKTEAATTYRSVDTYSEDGSHITEKVGNYYIWVNKTSSSYQLRYSSSANNSGTVLKSFSSSTYRVDSQIVTNGDVVFFAVIATRNLISTSDPFVLKQTGYIYKAKISTGKVSKVCTVTNLTSVEGYYGGRIYYTKRSQNYCDAYNKLCAYKVSTKKHTSLVSKYEGSGSWGKYFLGKEFQNGYGNVKLYLYNASTGKKTSPAKGCFWAVITSDRIIYLQIRDSKYFRICKCTFNGKTVTKLADTASAPFTDTAYPFFLTRQNAYFSGGYYNLSSKKWISYD